MAAGRRNSEPGTLGCAVDAADIALAPPAPLRWGLRENLQQFALLVLINAFVGGIVRVERTLVRLIGSETFQLDLMGCCCAGLVATSASMLRRRYPRIRGILVMSSREPH